VTKILDITYHLRV